MYKDLRDRNQVFSGVIARAERARQPGSYNGQTERARAELVSGNFFEVLGVRPPSAACSPVMTTAPPALIQSLS